MALPIIIFQHFVLVSFRFQFCSYFQTSQRLLKETYFPGAKSNCIILTSVDRKVPTDLSSNVQKQVWVWSPSRAGEAVSGAFTYICYTEIEPKHERRHYLY